jgi:putative transposase
MKEIADKLINGCIHIDDQKQCGKEIHETSKYFCSDHGDDKIDWGIPFSFIGLRKIIMKNNDELTESEKWQNEVHYDVRQLILKDVVAALKACITNKKEGNIESFELGYKSKKDKTQIFHIPSKFINFNKMKFFKSSFYLHRKMKTWIKNKLGNKLTGDLTIQKQGSRYYICVPFTVEKQIPQNRFKLVSLDPGVRAFLALWSPEGISGKLGEGIEDEIYELCLRIDDIVSEIAIEASKQRRYRLRKRMRKLRTKVTDIVDNLHNQCANFLCSNFETIIIPKFEAGKKASKKGRKINNETVRKMFTLSHGRFMEKLKDVAERMGTHIIECSEEYTSQTCGLCGNLNKKLGSSKVYRCKECDYEEDRDINGARNICIKVLTIFREKEENEMELGQAPYKIKDRTPGKIIVKGKNHPKDKK